MNNICFNKISNSELYEIKKDQGKANTILRLPPFCILLYFTDTDWLTVYVTALKNV